MPSIFQLAENDRSIFFFDQVYQWTAQSIISDLIRMNDEDKEKPISLFINSHGGSVFDMLGIVDVMKTIKAPIDTYILGSAYSAASLIAACGNKGKRFISANSEMMIHEAAMQGFGFIDTRDEKFTNALERVKQLNTRINNIYSQVSGKSFDEIDKILSSKDDTFMTAEEAVKFGLVDEIMTSEQINSIKLSEQFKPIKLSEAFSLNDDKDDKGLKTVHLLKATNIDKYGVEITSETLKSLKANFDNNVRGQEISIDYTHENDNGENPAAAWIKDLSLDKDNKNLFAKVEYTPKAEQMIKDKEYKYVSSDIDQVWVNEDGKMFNNVLCGGTFTNRPVVKGLNTMKLSEKTTNINNNKIDMDFNKSELTSIENVKTKLSMKVEDIYDSLVAMAEKNKKIEAKNTDLTAASAKFETDLKAAKKELLDKDQEQVNAEKLLKVEALIEKGIILNAHKDKVLEKFSTKAEIEDFYKDVPAILKVKATGSGVGDGTPKDLQLEAEAKRLNIDAEDLKNYGPEGLKTKK